MNQWEKDAFRALQCARDDTKRKGFVTTTSNRAKRSRTTEPQDPQSYRG